MRRLAGVVIVAWLVWLGIGANPAQASGEFVHLVQAGDTIYSIAARYGVSMEALATANGFSWNTVIYPGQQIIIPNQSPNQLAPFTPPPGFGEAKPPAAYPGQKPGFYGPPALPSAPWQQSAGQSFSPWNNNRAPLGEKWIDVDLTAQVVTAYEGQTPVFRTLASTGIWKYPTVAGTFSIYVKYESTRMTGGYGEDAYDLADVPYVMYFHGGYGLHGTYWHNNFGTPMSHGCVNLSIRDAEWLYHWAPVGTKVVSHY